MANSFNHTQFGISVSLEPKIIRVDSSEALYHYFRVEHQSGLVLAKALKNAYENTFGCPVRISDRSLAVEILGHFYLQQFFLSRKKSLESRGKKDRLEKLTRSMLAHTSVIDCGERTVDNNRFVWDILSVFYLSFPSKKKESKIG